CTQPPRVSRGDRSRRPRLRWLHRSASPVAHAMPLETHERDYQLRRAYSARGRPPPIAAAVGACCSVRREPASGLRLDHARIADHVVEGALLRIEARDDVADQEDQRAELLGKVSPHGTAVADEAATRANYFQTQRHLAGRRPEAANKKRLIRARN